MSRAAEILSRARAALDRISDVVERNHYAEEWQLPQEPTRKKSTNVAHNAAVIASSHLLKTVDDMLNERFGQFIETFTKIIGEEVGRDHRELIRKQDVALLALRSEIAGLRAKIAAADATGNVSRLHGSRK